MMPELITAIVTLRVLTPMFAGAWWSKFNSKNRSEFRMLVADVYVSRD